MLMPKKTKYRKMQRGRLKGRSKGARSLAFGEYGLEAIEPCWVTNKQIEAMRVCLARGMKKEKEAKFVMRIFPDKPITKKPAETRMGKGKGNVEEWVAVVKRGRIICELQNVSQEEAKRILRGAAYKLPMKTRFVNKNSGVTKNNEQVAS